MPEGSYSKEADYGSTSLDFTTGPFRFEDNQKDPNEGGGDGDPVVEAPESLSGLEVEIHFLELMANGFYEDLGMRRSTLVILK